MFFLSYRLFVFIGCGGSCKYSCVLCDTIDLTGS